jgi:hypothetical protein
MKSGLDTAKAKGVKLGRPVISLPDGFDEVYKKYASKEITATKAMEVLALKNFFYKLVKRYRTTKIN